MSTADKRLELINLINEDDIKDHKDLYLICEACGIDTVRKLLLAFPDGIGEIRIPHIKRFDKVILKFMDINKSLSQKEVALITGSERRTISRIKNR